LANFNSVTGIRIKPTQLAGGYGQLHFALNYWGPTGVQRDTRVEVEKYTG
jgi:nitrate reductase alpha subunit